MIEKGILKKIDDIFNYCEEIDNHLPKEEQTGYRMLPDILYIQKEVRNLQHIIKEALEYICERFEYIEETGEYYLTHTFDKDNLFELYKILRKGEKHD